MDLKVRSIAIQQKYKLQFHPLTKKLYDTFIKAYVNNKQVEYLTQIDELTTGISNFPLHQISVINIGINEYQIIGGCFSPLFNINNLNRNNTLLLSYTSSIKAEKSAKIKAERKRLNSDAQPNFEQLIIDFIYMDFIRAASLLSLKKPGLMTNFLRQISQEYHSRIWRDIFGNKHSYFQLTNLVLLTNTARSAINQQKSSSHTSVKWPN